MAVLSEIRKRSWILIAVVALGLLAFLIEPGSLIQNLKQINPNKFGYVNDRVITREDYDASMLVARQSSQGRTPELMLRNQAWEGAIQNKLLHTQAEKAGLEVSDEVVFAYNPDFKAQVDQVKSMASSGDPNAKQYLMQLNDVMNAQKAQVRNNLYNSLMSTTFLTNKIEVQHFKKNNSQQASVDYVKIDYNKYNEANPTKVSDGDLEKYIKEHKNLFKRQATTSFHYVFFPSEPSAKDKAIFDKNMNAILKGGVEYDLETGEPSDSIQSFASAKNDSLYVSMYSLEPFNPTFYGVQQISQQFNPQVSNWVKSAEIGSVYGPFEKSGYTIVSKLSAKKPLDSIKTKHILIAYEGAERSQATRSKEEASALATQLLQQVKQNPASFATLARDNSDDKGSAQRGGELGWVTDNTGFVPEYTNYLKSNPVGTVGIQESPFGYHIISVEEKKQGTSYQLANVIKEDRASKETENELFNKANAFLAEVKGKTLQDFVNLASEKKYKEGEADNVSRFQGMIPSLNSDKDDEIIAWTFNEDRKLGESNIFNTANGDYVVVRLTGRAPAGMATPAQVREQYEPVVRNEKIAKSLYSKIKSTDLNAIAKEYGGEMLSDSVNMVQYVLAKSGREPVVAGAAFGLKDNEVSKALEGTSGVFVVKSKGLKPKNFNLDDASISNNIEMQNKGTVNQILQALRRESEVEDDRARLFN